MACDFDGTTSAWENTSAALGLSTLVTISVWAYADGVGESSGGTIIAIPEAGSAFFLNHGATANVLRFWASLWTPDSQWTFPATDGQWNKISLSYDAGSTSNVPVVRVNNADVTVTEVTAPGGTWGTVTSGYCIGNIANRGLTWNGMIQHPQVFSAILAAREMDQSVNKPGSIRRGIKLWLPMLHPGDTTDLSGNAFNATAVAVTNRESGPSYAPIFSGWGGYPYAVAAPGGGSSHRPSLAMLGVG